MTKKKQVGVRFDSNRTRLKTGETQRPNGTYAYRWSTPDGKRHSIYAPTLEKLREQEEQIIVDKHDGIRSDVKSITVNEMFDLWCQLKRGIKDSTFKNYIYMYELFVKPSFGKNRLVQVKKSDVRKFYNSLADGKVLKIATIDNVHNVLHQVFQVAVDDGMIRQNPTDNMLKELKLSHGFEREKKEALTVAQQKLFFDYIYKDCNVEEEIVRSLDIERVRAALKALTPEERDIIMNFYFSENPLLGEALAEKFATTKSSIYRRRDHALRKLKSILGNA